uniref:B30.2/SPRY domain-containing protein n=1 Tax=Monopterus albus TaxID=43700 RepID=A0A3Q3KGG0_MONAL
MVCSGCLLTEDQFLCSICLDVFTNPVCPVCKEIFYMRPELRVNTLISQMAAELGKTEAEIQQMIQRRREKILEITDSVEFSNGNANRERAVGLQVFTALKEFVDRGLAELLHTIKEMQIPIETVQHNAVDVTLEPDTANPWLTLPDDGKQVKFGDENKNLSDNPKRFSYYASVLGKQSFTSGRFYYEVQVKGKTKWDLGVVRESINRKGPITINPTAGYWTLSLRTNNEYKALSDPRVHLSLKSKPGKVGVFVDYEGGLVSFYDADAAALIYSFIGCPFTERLYPFFNPCNNDGGRNALPLIIYPFHNISANM